VAIFLSFICLNNSLSFLIIRTSLYFVGISFDDKLGEIFLVFLKEPVFEQFSKWNWFFNYFCKISLQFRCEYYESSLEID